MTVLVRRAAPELTSDAFDFDSYFMSIFNKCVSAMTINLEEWSQPRCALADRLRSEADEPRGGVTRRFPDLMALPIVCACALGDGATREAPPGDDIAWATARQGQPKTGGFRNRAISRRHGGESRNHGRRTLAMRPELGAYMASPRWRPSMMAAARRHRRWRPMGAPAMTMTRAARSWRAHSPLDVERRARRGWPRLPTARRR